MMNLNHLMDQSYFASDIQDYFENIIKKHETLTDNPTIQLYINKIENRIRFKTENVYYPELNT